MFRSKGFMFDGISKDRFLKMTDQERRWLNNIKKAVYASDQALLSERPQDRCPGRTLQGA
jgi:hypothetical protein